MTPKQVKFCDEYLIDNNATQAAIRAGYSKKTAGQIGEQNLRKLEIAKYIEERLQKAQIRNEITLDDIIKELDENRYAALAAETVQSAAATSATMAKAKLLGFVVERSESKVESTFEQTLLVIQTQDLTDEQLRAISAIKINGG